MRETLVRGRLRELVRLEVTEKRSHVYTGVRVRFGRDMDHRMAFVPPGTYLRVQARCGGVPWSLASLLEDAAR